MSGKKPERAATEDTQEAQSGKAMAKNKNRRMELSEEETRQAVQQAWDQQRATVKQQVRVDKKKARADNKQAKAAEKKDFRERAQENARIFPLPVSVAMLIIGLVLSFVDLMFLTDVIGQILGLSTGMSYLVGTGLGLVGMAVMALLGWREAEKELTVGQKLQNYVPWFVFGLLLALTRLFSAKMLGLAANDDEPLTQIVGMMVRSIDLIMAPLMFVLYLGTGELAHYGMKSLLLNPGFGKWIEERNERKTRENAQRTETAVKNFVSQGDLLFNKGKFLAAQKMYYQAENLQNQYPKIFEDNGIDLAKKLAEVQEKLGIVSVSEIKGQFSALLSAGDKLFVAKKYEEAKDKYRAALDLANLHNENFSDDEIASVDEKLAKADRASNEFSESSDLQKNYEDAKNRYEELKKEVRKQRNGITDRFAMIESNASKAENFDELHQGLTENIRKNRIAAKNDVAITVAKNLAMSGFIFKRVDQREMDSIVRILRGKINEQEKTHEKNS